MPFQLGFLIRPRISGRELIAAESGYAIVEVLGRQLDRFRGKFGREPGEGDPIFRDPDADEPQLMDPGAAEDKMLAAMRTAGVDPALLDNWLAKRLGVVWH